MADDDDEAGLDPAVDEDELEQEMADDDGMARPPVGFAEDAAEDAPDDDGSEEKS